MAGWEWSPRRIERAIMSQILAGARASGVTEENLPEYQKSILARLAQENKQATVENVHAATLSGANIGGKLRMSGEQFLGAQQQLGRVEGLDQDQMWAELGTLTSKKAGGGGMDSGKAAQSLTQIATTLKAIPEQGRKALGEDLSKLIEGQMEKGDIMGALSTLGEGLDKKNVKGAERTHVLESLGGRRMVPALERLVDHRDVAQGFLAGSHDEQFFNKRLEVATSGTTATRAAIAAREKEVKLIDPDRERMERNEQLLRLLDAELADKVHGAGMGAARREMIMGGVGLNQLGLGGVPIIGKLGLPGTGWRASVDRREFMGSKPDLLKEFEADAGKHGYSDSPFSHAIGLGGGKQVDVFRHVLDEYNKANAPSQAPTVPGQVPAVVIPKALPTPAGAFEPSAEDKAKLAWEEAHLKHEQHKLAYRDAHHGKDRYDHSKEGKQENLAEDHLKAIYEELKLANEQRQKSLDNSTRDKGRKGNR